jgi:hypothetical protein
MNIDIGILSDLSQRLSTGERVKPETDAEKKMLSSYISS